MAIDDHTPAGDSEPANAWAPIAFGVLQRLPQAVQELNDRWHIVRKRGCRTQDLQELRRLTHALVGTLTGTPLTRSFNVLRRVDDRLRFFANTQTQPLNTDQETLGSLIASLRTSVSQEILTHVAVTAPAAPAGGAPGVGPEGAPNSDSDRGLNILPQPLLYVFDKNPSDGRVLAPQLALHGFTVEVFTATEALRQAIAARPPQVLLVDMSDGCDPADFASLATLKPMVHPPLPMAFILGRGDTQARLHALRAGCDTCFAAPVPLAPLVARLRAFMDREPTPAHRVLMLDPDRSLLERHAGFLRKAGCEVRTTTDALALLDMAFGFQPEVIVLDPHMPEADGAELRWLLQQEESFLHLPLVFLSADPGSQEGPAPTAGAPANGIGVTDILAKPVTEARLVDLVRTRAQQFRCLASKAQLVQALREERAAAGLVDPGPGGADATPRGRPLHTPPELERGVAEAAELETPVVEAPVIEVAPAENSEVETPVVRPLTEAERQEWIQRISRAVADQRLFLVYQPIASVEAADPTERYEVLLRIRDPDGTVILPGAFIDMAERVGVAHLLDRWVISHGLEVLAVRQQTHPATAFFLKLSAGSIQNADFVDWLAKNPGRANLRLGTCVLELDEADVMSHPAEASALIEHLRTLGIPVVLEHFGAHSNAVALLPDLKPDYVKVHHDLTQHLHSSSQQRERLQHLLQQAHHHKIRTMAAYIEDANGLALLWQSGVDFIQGNFLNPPGDHLGQQLNI